MKRISKPWVIGVGAVGMVLASALGVTGATAGGKSLALVAYSTPKDAYSQIIPAFQKTKAGKGVGFSQSYGPSGQQSRAVKNGLPADVVAFALAPDITRLTHSGLVSKKWTNEPHHGMVTDSVTVFVTRSGNPKHIKTWKDLIKPGVKVVNANPFLSGGARWNVMAAYGSQRQAGKSRKQAVKYLQKLYKHVVAQPASAREALQTWAQGEGDVLLSYENEAIFAKRNHVPLYYKIPGSTILIENPVAPIKTSKNAKTAKAFVRFLWSKKAQTIYAKNGFRPTVKKVAKRFHFPRPRHLFTINSFHMGGWRVVQKRFFDPHTGIMVKIERNSGH
jgi:sulfate/thiosulfate transport system substrate-binding protein